MVASWMTSLVISLITNLMYVLLLYDKDYCRSQHMIVPKFLWYFGTSFRRTFPPDFRPALEMSLGPASQPPDQPAEHVRDAP